MDRQPQEAGLDQRRERAVERLMESFANDVLDVDEFERRLDLANRSSSSKELDELLSDLPKPGSAVQMREADSMVQPQPLTVAPAHQVRDRQLVMAMMGGAERKGRWIPARRMNVISMMGGVGLDFREAMMGPGVTEVWIFTMWGGVEIIVPPELPVEVDGMALMGGFELDSNEPIDRSPDQPLLRIRGMALMGGVEVTVRLPGETAKDARRRRKLEKKLRRRLPKNTD